MDTKTILVLIAIGGTLLNTLYTFFLRKELQKKDMKFDLFKARINNRFQKDLIVEELKITTKKERIDAIRLLLTSIQNLKNDLYALQDSSSVDDQFYSVVAVSAEKSLDYVIRIYSKVYMELKGKKRELTHTLKGKAHLIKMQIDYSLILKQETGTVDRIDPQLVNDLIEIVNEVQSVFLEEEKI